jgi:hypothetical protein
MELFSGVDTNLVYPINLKQVYSHAELARINLMARLEYPPLTFTNKFNRYITSLALPTTSYFAVQDAETQEYIIRFDDMYTKISSDENGPYFNLDMTTLPQERFFRILIKVVTPVSIDIFKDNKVFKVSR